MTPADLKILVQEGEGTTLEFKESLSSSFARELVALANTIGGKVLLGVRDDGSVAGVKDSNHLRARIQDIARNCDPPVKVVVEDAMRFIERNTRTAWRIEALQRENIPEYPMKALREAITNAVMHRDWFVEGGNVFVELYTDRIEVVSPGGLPKGMTLADLGTKSVRRNALIADLLHRIDFIEKAGTGVKRIREEAREGGYPEPVWEAGGFTTAIFRPNPEVRAAATVRSGAQSGAQSEQVLAALSQGEQSAGDLAEALSLRSKTGALKRTLNELVAGGLVEYTLPDKPTSRLQRYRLTRAGGEYLKKNKEPK